MNPGDVIANRFVIERLAGTGGMGAVYRARDRIAGEAVALKILPAGQTRDAARFIREAITLSELKHPAIVRYVAHGVTPRDELYLAMEWLEGEDLLERLTTTGLTIAESVRVVTRVAQALALVHARGIVHRDLKPTNLWLQNGDIHKVKLLDFGIARFGHIKRLTVTGVLLGTPGYMAPEQARAEAVIDPRADIFALGCVLFECLTGRPAFAAESLLPLLAKILLEDVPPISELCVGVPDALEDLVARMLSKDPAARPRDGAAVAAELAGLEVPDRPSLPPPSRALSELTRGEQRLLSVALVARKETDETGEPAPMPPPPLLDAAAVQGLREAVEGRGGRFLLLADGSMVAMLSGGGVATDQAAQAARCALAMRAVAPDRPMALATGRGVVAARLPVGEAIDRAGRLLLLAEAARSLPGIVLDEVTAGLLDAHFEVQGSETGLFLCGERELANAARTLLGKPTSCVGRDRELRILEGAFNECVVEPTPRAVLVTAPTGAGKSRLAYEFIRRLKEREGATEPPSPSSSASGPPSLRRASPASPVEIWTARGDPMTAGSAFGLLAQAIRRASGIFESEPLASRQRKLKARVARHVPPDEAMRVTHFLGELIGAPFPSDTNVQLRVARRDPMVMGDQMHRAFEDFLRAECEAQPVVLVLEDLHVGDRPTVSFLDGALRNLHERPLLVIALARPEVRSMFPDLWADRGVLEVRLGPLSKRASERLAREVLGEEVEPETIDRIVAQADGHALFLEELIRAAAEGRGSALPATVVAIVQARLEGLEGETRRVLRAASVFGQTFWQRGVAALIGGSTRSTRVVECLDELEERELVTMERGAVARFPGEVEYVFRSALVREAAYGMLTESDRVLGHKLAGAWLERAGETHALTLAEHFERGGEPRKAIAWYRRAATQALDGNDLERAILYGDRGAQAGASGEALGELRLAQAEAHRWRAEYAAARERAQEAMRLLPRGGELWCMAATSAATASGLLGDYDVFVDLVAEMRSLWRPGPVSRPHAMAAARAVVFLIYANQLQLAGAILDEDLAVIEPAAEADPSVMAILHQAHAVRALFRGDPGGSLEHLTAGMRSHEQAGDLRGACMQRVNVGYTYLETGAYEEAEEVLRQALSEATRMGLGHVIPGAKQNLGIALAHLGKLAEAHLLETQAVAAFAAQGNRRMETAARTYLARILALAGDKHNAEQEATAALRVSEGSPASRAHALTVLSELRLSRGRVDEARDLAAEAMGIVETLGGIDAEEARVRLVLAKAQHAAGLDEAARRTIEAARARLVERAEKILDDALRKSFLERVPEHARTLSLARQWLGAGA